MKTINKYFLAIIVGIVTMLPIQLKGHHYKGLPHYNYFDNYPQVPLLEFIKEGKDYAAFVTIYNFQGLSLDMVEAPNDVRFYIYLYDMGIDNAYTGKADFNIYSHDELIESFTDMQQMEERIFVLRAELIKQDDLILEAIVTDKFGEKHSVNVPIEITDSFFDKYGTYISIAAFFILVAVIKKVSDFKNKEKKIGAK